LVDQKTFDEIQAIISEHASAPRSARRTVRFFLLTGLVRCCECGGAMAGQTNVRIAKDGSRIETRFYRDRTILDDGGICGKMISADKLETQVEAEIKRIVLPPTWKERIVALAQSSPQFNVMERKRRELRSQMSRLQSLYVKGSMTSEEFERSQKLLNRRIAEIALPLSQSGNRVMRMLDDFPTLWDRLTREEKKRMIRKMVQAVWVRDGRLERIELRDLFKPAGMGQMFSVEKGLEILT
jgi:site-specific DNA recombinase